MNLWQQSLPTNRSTDQSSESGSTYKQGHDEPMETVSTYKNGQDITNKKLEAVDYDGVKGIQTLHIEHPHNQRSLYKDDS